MGETVYIRMKKNIKIDDYTTIKLEDISYLSGNPTITNLLEKTSIYKITEEDKNISVIDGFTVIKQLVPHFPNVDFQLLGPSQTIISITKQNKKTSIFLVSIIWLLLFIGSAMAIMNFHYDVSMQEVQQQLHFMLTGTDSKYPLWFQIPYSIGLGVGMILFFNHLFRKRFNEEPSPLEIELFKYQQDLDNYVSYYENKINKTNDTN